MLTLTQLLRWLIHPVWAHWPARLPLPYSLLLGNASFSWDPVGNSPSDSHKMIRNVRCGTAGAWERVWNVHVLSMYSRRGADSPPTLQEFCETWMLRNCHCYFYRLHICCVFRPSKASCPCAQNDGEERHCHALGYTLPHSLLTQPICPTLHSRPLSSIDKVQKRTLWCREEVGLLPSSQSGHDSVSPDKSPTRDQVQVWITRYLPWTNS